MLIAGLQKTSMLDYPGKPCAVVFVPYCNMRCWYCHNEHILTGETELIPEEEVLAYLEKRSGRLQACVISGGEPTLQPGLVPFIERVRAMGYLIKLDTNGTKPETVRELIQKKLINYVAMDIKAGPAHYNDVTRSACDLAAIKKTVFYLRNTGIAHEFRTTFAPTLTKEDILEAAELIAGTERYYLQQYRKRKDEDPEPHVPSYLEETAAAVTEKIGVCTLRGV